MTVSDLIEKLKQLPQDKPAYILYDGEPRIEIEIAYESKKGAVIVAGANESVYSYNAVPFDVHWLSEGIYKTPSVDYKPNIFD